MNHKLKKNIGFDYIHVFLTNLNMQSSIWMLYLAYCGMNLFQIGILEGLYHVTSMICEIPSGAVADLLGRKKSMILSKLCITISCFLMLFGHDFGSFALSFIIQALGNNFNSGSEEALVYDSMLCLHEEDHYIRVNGRINLIIEITQALATVIGGVLAEYSYVACYGASTVISVLALVPILFMVEPPLPENSKPEKKGNCLEVFIEHFKTSYQILKSDRRIFQIIVYYSVVFAAHTLLFFYSQQYYYDMGFNKIYISIIMLFAGIAACLGAVSSEKLYFRFKDQLAEVSAIIIAIAIIGYGYNNVVLSIALFIVANFFNSVLYPVESESLNRLIPSKQRATLISVSSMFFSIAMILVFPLVGFLSDQIQLSLSLTICGVILLIFIVMWNIRLKKSK